MMRSFDLLLEIERSDSARSVVAALRKIAAPLGFDRFVIACVSPKKEDLIERLFWVEGDWFGDGSEVDPVTYVRRCPITRHVLDRDDGFFWTKSVDAKGEMYKVVLRPNGEGIHGFQVPVFDRLGLKGAVSFGGVKIDSSDATRLILTMAGASAFNALRRIETLALLDEPARLTAREREVLEWIAAGRRQRDIAQTLGLSDRTIENHLRRARKRLGVATTAEAIRISVRLGILSD